MAVVIDGKQAAASVIAAVRKSSRLLEEETGVKPGLAVVHRRRRSGEPRLCEFQEQDGQAVRLQLDPA